MIKYKIFLILKAKSEIERKIGPYYHSLNKQDRDANFCFILLLFSYSYSSYLVKNPAFQLV